MKNKKGQKGFTLIELLVVIAIIAILAVVVILTLNPAELLRQARDSNRVSDFATLKSALSLYATDVSTTTAMFGASGQGGAGDGTYALFTASAAALGTTSTYNSTNTAVSWGFLGAEIAIATNTSRSVGGTGWIPVNLNAISSGAPIATLPVDPITNSTNTTYVYAASSTVFKLAAHMESLKYSTNGSGDVETGDGGNTVNAYEQGTALTVL